MSLSNNEEVWTKQFSKKNNCEYWFNSATGESSWEDPTVSNKKRKLENDVMPSDLNKEQKSSSTENNVEIAIIVPFRDDGDEKGRARSAQLRQFVPTMTNFLAQSGKTFRIYIIEQSKDNRKFNRGKLLNIGFDIARSEGCLTYIFHDVDLIPSVELLPFYSTTPLNNPVHIARVWKGRYADNAKYFGGIVAFSREMYENINGFPNNFWGWGGEDDEMYTRTVKECHYTPSFPLESDGGCITDLEHMNLKEKLQYLKQDGGLAKCNNKIELLATHAATWRTNGLTTDSAGGKISYEVLNRLNSNGEILSGEQTTSESAEGSVGHTYARITVDVKLNNDWADLVCGKDDKQY